MNKTLDNKTVEDLYRSYGAQIERRCRTFLHDPDEAADAVQEVFVRLITKGADFRSHAEWRTWLYRVTINVCLNCCRNRQRRRTLIEQHGDALRPRASCDPTVLRDCSTVLGLLDSEDSTTQKAVIFHYMNGMSQHEIGEQIGLSRISVNKRLAKFKRRAQKQMRIASAARAKRELTTARRVP